MKFENHGVSVDMEQCSAMVYGKRIQEKRPTALYVSCMESILEACPQLLGQREALFTVDAERASKYTGSTKTIQIQGMEVYVNTGLNTQSKLKNLEKTAVLAENLKAEGQGREEAKNTVIPEPAMQKEKAAKPEPVMQKENKKEGDMAEYTKEQILDAYLDLMNVELEEYVYGDGRLEKYVKSMLKEWQKLLVPETESLPDIPSQLEQAVCSCIDNHEVSFVLLSHLCYWRKSGGKKLMVDQTIAKVPEMLETFKILSQKGFAKAQCYYAAWRGAGLIARSQKCWGILEPSAPELVKFGAPMLSKAPELVSEMLFAAYLNLSGGMEEEGVGAIRQLQEVMRRSKADSIWLNYPLDSAGNYWNYPIVYAMDERKYHPFQVFQIQEKNGKLYYMEGSKKPDVYDGALHHIHELDFKAEKDRVLLKIEDGNPRWRGFPDTFSFQRVCQTKFPMFSLFDGCIYYTSNDVIYCADLQGKVIEKKENISGKNNIYAGPVKLRDGLVYISKSDKYVMYYYDGRDSLKIGECNQILAYNENEVYFTKKDTVMVFDSNDVQAKKIGEVYQNINKRKIIFVDAGKEIVYYLEEPDAVLGGSRLLGSNKEGIVVDVWEKPKLLSQLKRYACLEERASYESVSFDGRHLVFATNGNFYFEDGKEGQYGTMFFAFDRAGNAETILAKNAFFDKIGAPLSVTGNHVAALVHRTGAGSDYSLCLFPFRQDKNAEIPRIAAIV